MHSLRKEVEAPEDFDSHVQTLSQAGTRRVVWPWFALAIRYGAPIDEFAGN
jgi:hypothetical protein